jgi:hypothetical protein
MNADKKKISFVWEEHKAYSCIEKISQLTDICRMKLSGWHPQELQFGQQNSSLHDPY